MSRRIVGRIVGAALFAAAAAGTWYVLKAPEDPSVVGGRPGAGPGGFGGRPGAAAVAVEAAPVERGDIRDIRSFSGTLEPSAQFDVAPKTGGRLIELEVDIGDPVEKGMMIARLDSDEAVQQLEEARAALEVSRASLAEARSSLESKRSAYERTRQLREQKVASVSELEAAEAEAKAQEARVQLALAQVAQSEAAMKTAKIRLDYTTVEATWHDPDERRYVGERYVNEGATLTANAPIVSLVNIDRLTAVIYVAERDYPRISNGQAASIHADALPGHRFSGEVARIAPQFSTESRQARVEVEIANPDHLLKPGMFVRIDIELAHVENTTLVPVSAVVEHQGQTGVFQIDMSDSTAHFVPVRTGILQGGQAQIVEPTLGEGPVVVLGQHLLHNGSAVLLPSTTGAAAREPQPGPSGGNLPGGGARANGGDRPAAGEAQSQSGTSGQ